MIVCRHGILYLSMPSRWQWKAVTADYNRENLMPAALDDSSFHGTYLLLLELTRCIHPSGSVVLCVFPESKPCVSPRVLRVSVASSSRIESCLSLQYYVRHCSSLLLLAEVTACRQMEASVSQEPQHGRDRSGH